MEMMAYYESLLECAKRSKIKTSTKQKTQNTMMCCARKQVNETVVKETCKAPTSYVASDTMYFTCANGQNLIL